MPQVSIYVDEDLLKKIERAAKKEHASISKWVQEKLRRALEDTWPKGYFELFGSLADTDFERPPQPSLADDAPREQL